MKNAIILGVVVFAGLFLAGFIQKSLGATPLEEDQQIQIFTNPKIGLTMNYPSDWSAISIPGDPVADKGHLHFIGFCPSSYLSKGDYPFSGCQLDSPVNVQINAYQLNSGTTTKEFYDKQQALITAAENLAGENEILEKDKVEISGLSAIQIVSTHDESSGSIGKLLAEAGVESPTNKDLSVFLVNANGSMGYTVRGSTEDEQDFDDYLPTIQKMIDSLRIDRIE